MLVRLALTVTSLTIGLTAPVAGVVTDRLGRKPVLVAALILYAVSGVAGFFLSDLTAILVTRAFLGIAVGGIMTAVSALIVDLFAGPRRGAFLGLQAAFASLGGIIFLPAGGFLAEVSWHAPFWIYAVSLTIVPFAVFSVPGRTMVSAGGARPSSAATDRVGSSTRWRLLGLYGLAFAGTLVFFMAPTQLPFALQRFHVAPTVTGLVIAGSTVTSAIAALGYTRVRQRLSLAAVNALSLALLGAGWVVVGTAGTLPQLVLGVLVGGLGVGLVIPKSDQAQARRQRRRPRHRPGEPAQPGPGDRRRQELRRRPRHRRRASAAAGPVRPTVRCGSGSFVRSTVCPHSHRSYEQPPGTASQLPVQPGFGGARGKAPPVSWSPVAGRRGPAHVPALLRALVGGGHREVGMEEAVGVAEPLGGLRHEMGLRVRRRRS